MKGKKIRYPGLLGRTPSSEAGGCDETASLPAEWIDPLLAGCFSLGIFLFAHFSAFMNPHVINDDVRQQIYWMQQWQDPEIYQSDWLSDYARHYVPWGVQGLYRAVSGILGPLWFSRVLPGFLFVFQALFLWEIGRLTGGRRLSWMMIGVFWLMPFFLDSMSGGLSRSFAAPLLTFFWLCWLIKSAQGMGITLLLQSLFIPYMFPLSSLAVLLALGASLIRRTEAPPFPAKPVHFALILIAGGLVALWYSSLNAAGYGPLVDYADMVGHPEFTEQGRYPILPVPSIFWELVGEPLEFLAYPREGKIMAGIATSALFLGFSICGWRRLEWSSLKGLMQPVLYLGVASLILYFSARLFLLKLFIPSRYLSYTVNLFYCMVFALFADHALRKKIRPRILAALLFLVVVLAGIRLRGVALYDYSQDRTLYEMVEETPKDALIAGHPALMDNVLTFSRRRVFASFELSHPWCKGLWMRLKPELEAFFSAYYAEDPKAVETFCRKYAVDFLVVDDRHFQPEFLAGQPYFAPFDELIRSIAKDHRHFAVLTEGSFQTIRVNEHQWIIHFPRSADQP